MRYLYLKCINARPDPEVFTMKMKLIVLIIVLAILVSTKWGLQSDRLLPYMAEKEGEKYEGYY